MLKVESTAIVLIDVQGKLASLMFERERLVQNLQILLKSAHILDLPILWLEQVRQPCRREFSLMNY